MKCTHEALGRFGREMFCTISSGVRYKGHIYDYHRVNDIEIPEYPCELMMYAMFGVY